MHFKFNFILLTVALIVGGAAVSALPVGEGSSTGGQGEQSTQQGVGRFVTNIAFLNYLTKSFLAGSRFSKSIHKYEAFRWADKMFPLEEDSTFL